MKATKTVLVIGFIVFLLVSPFLPRAFADSLYVEWGVNDSSPEVGEEVTFSVTITREGNPVTDYRYNVTRNDTDFGSFTTNNFTDSSITEITYIYNITWVIDYSDNLTDFTKNQETVTVEWTILPAGPGSIIAAAMLFLFMGAILLVIIRGVRI